MTMLEHDVRGQERQGTETKEKQHSEARKARYKTQVAGPHELGPPTDPTCRAITPAAAQTKFVQAIVPGALPVQE